MREKSSRQTFSERGSFGRFAWMALVALSFLGGNCEPNGPESAGAAMIASPFAFLAGLVMLLFLHWIWKPMIDAQPFFRKSFVTTLGVLVGLSLLGNFAVPGASEWAMPAVGLFGTSYLSVLLLVWRIWLFKKKETAFSRAPIATLITLMAPVPILLWVPLPKEVVNSVTALLWILPGLAGYVTFPLFMMAVSEAIARRIFPKNAQGNDSHTLRES
jgi:hypothetical protein